MTTHELKTWPDYFRAVQRAEKRFEVRKDDRDFKVGDEVILREYRPDTNEYTGRKLGFEVGFVLRDFPGVAEGFVVMQLRSRVGGKVGHCQIGHDAVLRLKGQLPDLTPERAATILAVVAGIEQPSEPYQSEYTSNWCFHALDMGNAGQGAGAKVGA